MLPNRSTRPDFDTPTRIGNWYKGGPTPPLKEISKPSQAKKRKAIIPITASLSPTKAAQKLIDSTEDTRATKRFRTTLSEMVGHCNQLKAKLGAAFSKIAHMSRLLTNSTEETAEVQECICCDKCSFRSHTSSASKIDRELIGQGYDPKDTGRTLRRHRLAVMRALEKECGPENKLRQYGVAYGVMGMFKQKSTTKTLKQIASRDAVLKGLETNFAIISTNSHFLIFFGDYS